MLARLSTAKVVSLITEHGEVIGVDERRRVGETFGRGKFVIFFQDAVDQAVKQFRSGPSIRVLLALTRYLDFKTWRRVDQAELAGELGLDRAQVTRALLEFLRLGYVERSGKRSQYLWRLTPKLGWRGDVKSYHAHMAALRDTAEPRLPLGPVKIAESILWKVSCYTMRHGHYPSRRSVVPAFASMTDRRLVSDGAASEWIGYR